MRRLRALGIAFCILCVAGGYGTAPAPAQTKLATVRLAVVPAIVSAQAYVAEELGIFRKAGLNVEMQPMNSGASAVAALFGGALDVGFSDPVAVSAAHTHNLPLVFVAPGMVTTTETPILAVIVKADGPLRVAKDLNGKTIAIGAVKSMQTIAISTWIDGNGGDSKTVRFIEFPIPQMATAVANGTVDAAFPPEPFVTNAVNAGGSRALAFNKGLQNFMLSGWIANPAWLAENRGTAMKFIAAMHEAGDIVNRRPLSLEVAAAVSKYTKIPAQEIGHLLFLPQTGETLNAGELQPLIDAAAKYGVIEHAFPAGDIIYRAK